MKCVCRSELKTKICNMSKLLDILPGNGFLGFLLINSSVAILINNAQLFGFLNLCFYILLYILFSFKCDTSFD